MLFLVLVTDVPESSELRSALRQSRQSFLDAMARSGRLVAEGVFTEGGSLMLIEASSANDAIAVLQSDPYIVQPVSNRVQIRELMLNFVSPAILAGSGASSGAGPTAAGR
jgi:uncharacterized protein YciI